MDLVALSTEGTSNRQIAQELLSTGVTGALGQLRILLLQVRHNFKLRRLCVSYMHPHTPHDIAGPQAYLVRCFFAQSVAM
jgi:hypothetical protein